MKILHDLYFYPWVSMTENNANAVFINGTVPILIDPGHAHLLNGVLESMMRDGIDPGKIATILFTHGHPDHIEASARFGDKVLRGLSKEEYLYMHGEGKNLFMASGTQYSTRPFDLLLNEGQLTLGDKTFTVIHTPGHSPGSICIYWKKEKVLISGDTLFYLGVGRTDLSGGDPEKLSASIHQLSMLDIEYLLPGHGEMLKGRKAIRENFKVILNHWA
jgi:hydroxyacylglutathione hydrolase